MKVIATQKGFYGDRIVDRGESFELPEGKKCSWAVPANEFKEEIEKSQEQLAAEAKEGSQGKLKPAKKAKPKVEVKTEEKVEKKVAKKAAKKKAAKKD